MLLVNGKQVAAEGIFLANYLEQEGFNKEHIAVELNGQIVPRASYAQTKLAAGDKLEIVRFVGGG